MVPSLVFPGMHTHMYIYRNKYIHTLSKSFLQAVYRIASWKGAAGYWGEERRLKTSTSPAGISFCKVAQSNFPRWQLLGSEDSHLGHNYLDFFLPELKNGTEDYSSFSDKQHCPLTSNCVYLVQLKWCKASANDHCAQTGYLILALNTHFICYLRHWSKLLCISAKCGTKPHVPWSLVWS